MSKKKKIVDAKNDSDGNITAVLIEGNKKFTSLETAMRMADEGKIEAVAVRPEKKKPHLRTLPDGDKKNNLDTLAES